MSRRLLVVSQLPPPPIGSSVMTKTFLETLERIGYAHTLVEKRFSRNLEEVGIPSFRKVMNIPVIAVKLLHECTLHRYDLCVYFISPGKGAFLVDCIFLQLLRILRLPWVLYFHGKGFDALAARKYSLWTRLVEMALGHAHGGITLGTILKEDVHRFIPDEWLVVVPNAIGNDGRWNRRKRSGNSLCNVLFLANLQPSKGCIPVLKTANEVISRNPRVRFILAGGSRSPGFVAQLNRYISENRLEEYVAMPGPLSGEAKADCFNRSDIFLFPTQHEPETFGLVNLEAMRAGLPVVSSSRGAIPEVVRDGETGFIIDPMNTAQIADRILLLASDENLRTEMGNRGRQVFEREYTYEAYGRNLSKALDFFIHLKEGNSADQPDP
jgi:glycosyltransferase involved in cell wall biosynthesis